MGFPLEDGGRRGANLGGEGGKADKVRAGLMRRPGRRSNGMRSGKEDTTCREACGGRVETPVGGIDEW